MKLAKAIPIQLIRMEISLLPEEPLKLTGQSGFDFDGTATYTGGDIYINGEKQTEIVNSMPGGGGAPGVGGPQGGGPGGGHQ